MQRRDGRDEADGDAIFAASSVGIAQADERGVLVRVNPAFCRMLGYPADRLLGRSFLEFTHPDDREGNWREHFTLTGAGAGGYELDKRFVRADGTLLWVHVTVDLVPPGSSHGARSMAVVHDISGRKEI
jgi:PAS domain S-box-containing protein